MKFITFIIISIIIIILLFGILLDAQVESIRREKHSRRTIRKLQGKKDNEDTSK